MNNATLATPRWGNEGRDRKARAILATMIRRCGDGITKGTWIDIGCGSGGIAQALAPHVDRIIGVDPEPWPEWDTMAGANENLEFVPSGFDGDHVPIPDGSADVVICNQVYEHVHHPERLIKNIQGLLKPGGVCYFAGPNLLWPIEPHVFWPFVHWLPRGFAQSAMRILGSCRADKLDAYSANVWSLRRWFQASGLLWEDSVAERVAVEFDMRGQQVLGHMAVRSLNAFRMPLAPFWPGFIFILRRPCA